MQSQLIPVPFYEDTVVLVGQNDEPYVAMKPIVVNLGLDWKGQHVKMTERFAPVMEEISTTGADGKQYGMTCLPLRKLPAWLYSISPNKVKPELRDKIIRYQNECDDALWNYWTQGTATRVSAPNITQQLAVSRHRVSLLKELHRTRDAALRVALHDQLAHASRLIGLSVPDLDSIGTTAPDVSQQLAPFWQALDFLDSKGEPYNHSNKPHLYLAIRPNDIQPLLNKHDGPQLCLSDLPDLLSQCSSPRFIERGRNLYSAIAGRTRRCWIFEPRAQKA